MSHPWARDSKSNGSCSARENQGACGDSTLKLKPHTSQNADNRAPEPTVLSQCNKGSKMIQSRGESQGGGMTLLRSSTPTTKGAKPSCHKGCGETLDESSTTLTDCSAKEKKKESRLRDNMTSVVSHLQNLNFCKKSLRLKKATKF